MHYNIHSNIRRDYGGEESATEHSHVSLVKVFTPPLTHPQMQRATPKKEGDIAFLGLTEGSVDVMQGLTPLTVF